MNRPLVRSRGLLLAALLGFAPTVRAEVVDRIAAVVDDDVITWGEIYDLGGEHIEANSSSGQAAAAKRRVLELEVLDVIIGRRLVEQEMRRLELDVTDADIERALSDIARQNGLEREQLRSEVEASGMTWESYREELVNNLREMKFNQQVLGPRITVRQDELRDAYRRSAKALSGPESIALQAIFLPYPADSDPDAKNAILAQAQALRQQAAAGADFAELAAQHSAEPYASRRGEMGNFNRGELVGELDRAAFESPVGDVAEPVVSAQGVFLLRPAERIAAEPPSFEEVENQLRQQLMEDKFSAAREHWLIQARRRSAVEVLLEPAG